MKKFYISILTVVLLVFSLQTRAQYTTVYQTIANDGNYHSLTDASTWLAPGPPVFDCTSCDIYINCNTTMDFIPGYFQYLTIIDSRITVSGNSSLAINTAFRLTNSKMYISTDATSQDTLFVNAQMAVDLNSSVTIGNPYSYIDVNNPLSIVPGYMGTYYEYFTAGPVAIGGLYTVPVFNGYGPYPGDPLGAGVVYQYAYLLTVDGYGTPEPGGSQPQYNINCSAPPAQAGCLPGVIYGPATTTTIIDPTTPTSLNNSHLEFIFNPTLPVVLVQLLATKAVDGTVNVIWATSQEENSSYYDVERSTDQSGWSKVGSVKAKGYASTTTNYKFNDKQPVDGTGYYRLKMVDLDGKFKYSKTVSVTSGKNNQALVIYSNPFNDQIRLKVNVSRAQNLTVTVSDMLGKTYINTNYHAQSGDNFVNLQPHAGSAGMYILHIHGDSYDQTAKLEKQ